ncbi:MAG TPA: hypothetical protein VLX92_30150 [Kofleriaceae bacterium]|nr:hypothetical protein [Kofleriaceae bacterium]
MRRLLVLVLVVGCGFKHGTGPSDAAPDGPPDGPKVWMDAPDAPPLDARSCFGGAAKWEICLDPPPTAALDLTALGTLVTDTDSHCLTAQPSDWTTNGQPDACIIAATTLTLSDQLVVNGNRPLVLVGTDSVTISGTLDVASHRGGNLGPGAGQFTCNVFGQTPDDGNGGNGGGGGAGGSLTTQGGDGGKGNNGSGKEGKVAGILAAPATLRAGCIGQDGGDGNSVAGSKGHAGAGGGGVYVLAGNSITITGTLNASGAGGSGGMTYGGGGGGGTGGVIVMYAPAIDATSGFILANGGGGSSGGDSSNAGNDGMNPTPTTPLTAAPGGAAVSSNKGGGGDGFAQGSSAKDGDDSSSGPTGGGGGGGAAGYILVSTAITGGTISPTPVMMP